MEDEVIARLGACEQRNRQLTRVVMVQFIVVALAFALLGGSCGTTKGMSQTTSSSADRLRLTELVIVDSRGVERVRISGDLPDAIIEGKRVPRGEEAAGVILYDGTGQERGGYVTWEPSGNVGLTLDTRKGQVTLFVAGPESGSALLLRNENDLIELRSDDDGSRGTAVKDGRIAFQQPPAGMSTEACSAYREARSRFADEEIVRECARRYPEATCRTCLEHE